MPFASMDLFRVDVKKAIIVKHPEIILIGCWGGKLGLSQFHIGTRASAGSRMYLATDTSSPGILGIR